MSVIVGEASDRFSVLKVRRADLSNYIVLHTEREALVPSGNTEAWILTREDDAEERRAILHATPVLVVLIL